MVDGPVTNRRFSRRQVRQVIMISGVVLAVLVVATGGWLMYSSSVETAAEESRQTLETNAKEHANKLSGFFAETTQKLKSLAAEKALIALFEQEDESLLIQEAEKRIKQFDSGLKLRLLKPGQYQLDSESNPPLTYASLDLLRQAEQSASPSGLEVVLFGAPTQHIVLVQRVSNKGGELIGLLHLSLDVALFEKAAKALVLTEGYAELQQPARGKPLVLVKRGDASFKGSEPLSNSVIGTRWTLSYWQGSAAPVADDAGGGIPFMPLVLALVAVLAVGGAVVFFLKRKSGGGEEGPAEDGGIVYAGAVQAIMDGAHPGMERLVPNLPNYGQKQAIAPVSEGMVGDDVTMIMRKEDVKAAAEQDVFDITGSEDITNPPASPLPAPVAPAPEAVKPEVPEQAASTAEGDSDVDISPVIFRAYDIRGIVGKTLNEDIVKKIGQAIGSEAGARGQQRIVVGRDGRKSSPELGDALIAGIQASGRNVIDVGVVPTPLLYFAAHFLETTSGVMLTGSHNGPEYNGVKIVLGDETLSEDAIQGLYKRITENDFSEGDGNLKTAEIIADYVRRVSEDIPVALSGSFKLVVDCGNGVAGAVAPQLFRALGHDVVELYCEVDGSFPNHHPDPSQPDNLQALIAKVKEEEADMGLAFDGDGDRLGVVDGLGNIIWPDRQLMLLAKDVLSRNEGAPIIFDVKCSRHLKAVVEASGGQAVMSKTGHSLIKNKMKEIEAPLAGEMSGHIFFKERWYGFDDALYTAARLMEVMVNAKQKPAEAFAELPEGISTPELKINLPEEKHDEFMQELKSKVSFDGAEIIDIDGIRVEFADGWGLIRPSNTTPCLVLRFEADDQTALERIQGDFRNLLSSVGPDLQLPF